MSSKYIKIVVVGDGACGKTCLLMAYKSGIFFEQHVPTIFENYSKTITYNGTDYILSLWDTAGQEAYEKLRPLSYSGANLVIICFAINNSDSLNNVHTVWIPEIRHYCPRSKILIVGTKSDLREDPQEQCILQETIEATIKRSNVSDIIECSAKTLNHIELVFDVSLEMILSNKRKRRFGFCKLC